MESSVRAFGSSSKKALEWVGATRQDIIKQNPGKDGGKALEAIDAIERQA